MTDIQKVKGWVEEYIRLLRMEAKNIEKVHGVGWVSDVKYQCADEAEEWLKSNPTEFDNPISAKCCMTPDSYKISHILPDNTYMEYTYADGTRKIVGIIKP